MTEVKRCKRSPVHRYSDGKPFRLSKQRDCSKVGSPISGNESGMSESGFVADARDWKRQIAVVDPYDQTISNEAFGDTVRRELKIRNYARVTVKSYYSAIRSFLDWAGIHFSQLTRDHVREYLEFLVDGGVTGTTLAGQLTAIRTCFDKFCLIDLTLGLATPRRQKKLPIVLSKNEIVRLLEAAVSPRDKLLLGMMYATGMRVSEVARIQFKDIDFERNLINIWRGKHGVDRQVTLPESYRSLLKSLVNETTGGPYLFPSETSKRPGRYLSPRTIQRVMTRTVQLAGILKAATPHSLRHSFATHCFEDGSDIRRIQKVLGHANLKTTTIYVRVAKPASGSCLPSPIDRLLKSDGPQTVQTPSKRPVTNRVKNDVGRFRIHLRELDKYNALVTIEVFVGKEIRSRVFLTGTRATEQRPGFWTLSFPPLSEWKPELARLPTKVRERINEADFYEAIRDAIVRSLERSAALGSLHRGDENVAQKDISEENTQNREACLC